MLVTLNNKQISRVCYYKLPTMVIMTNDAIGATTICYPDATDQMAQKGAKTMNDGALSPYNCMMDDHLKQVDALREMFKAEFEANAQYYDKIDYLRVIDKSQPWHCWRHLNQYKFNIEKAFDNMKNSLKWRKENNINHLEDSDFAKEFWLFGPIMQCGHNKDGNLVVYMIGSMFRPPKDKIRNQFKQFICNLLNTHDDKMSPREKVVIVFDDSNTTIMNFDLDLMRWAVSMMNYWPSRIYAVYVIGVPFILRPVVRMIISWLSEEWRSRVFCGTSDELLTPTIDRQQLPTYLKGAKDEIVCRLAPVGTRWAKDMKEYQDSQTLKHLEHFLSSSLTPEKQDEIRLMQVEHDKET